MAIRNGLWRLTRPPLAGLKATTRKREQDWPGRNRRADALSSLANKLYLKVGDLAAMDGDYQKAIQMFEKVAKHSADNNLMRVS